MEKDPMGKAMLDYLQNPDDSLVIDVNSNITEHEEIPVNYLFREHEDWPLLEQKAIDLCKGNILDVGAGAGTHALELQKRGHHVTALEISTLACQVMKTRAINNIVNEDFFFHQGQYDTLLFLMNGLGIAGTLNGLDKLLSHAKKLLKPGGQILCDSSDIIYMYEEEDGSYLININDNYYGQLAYEMSYADVVSEKFDWLFIDFDYLKEKASANGYICELVTQGEHYDYLARILLK